MRDQATINRIYQWAEKNHQKYFDQYQMSGSSATLKTAERYDDICDICRAAEIGITDEDITRKHIRRNQGFVIDSLHGLQKVSPGKTFSFQEVENWMKKMMA